MFDSFSLLNYCLILIALFSQYSIGKRFIKAPFICTTMIGISVSAVIVAIFANFVAILIKPFVLISITSAGFLTLYDFFKAVKNNLINSRHLLHFIILIFFSFIIFFINNPGEVHFDKTNKEAIKIQYNSHYTNYASLSLEMLDADYFSRLRHRDFYPSKWPAYHFFNSSAFALAQGLISKPNLWTYFMVQVILIIFIFSAMLEWFLHHSSFSFTRYILLLLWFTLLCTVWSIEWNIKTSGAFTIFGTFFVTINVLNRNYKNLVLFLLLTGISSFRMVSMTLPAVLFVLFYHLKIKLNSKIIKEWICKNKFLSGFFALFICYNFITVVTPLIITGYMHNLIFDISWLYYSGLFLIAFVSLYSLMYIVKKFLLYKNKYFYIVTFFCILTTSFIHVLSKHFFFLKGDISSFLIKECNLMWGIAFYQYIRRAIYSALIIFTDFTSQGTTWGGQSPYLELPLIAITSLILGYIFFVYRKQCLNDYQAGSFIQIIQKNKKIIIISNILTFIMLFQFYLYVVPYLIFILYLVWVCDKRTSQNKTKNLRDKFLFFLVFLLPGVILLLIRAIPILGLVSGLGLVLDCIVLTMLLYWISILTIPKKKIYSIYLCFLIVFLLSNAYFFDIRFSKVSYLNRNWAYTNIKYKEYYPIIHLNENDYNNIQVNSKNNFIYDTSKSAAWNNLYACLLGVRIIESQYVYNQYLKENIHVVTVFLLSSKQKLFEVNHDTDFIKK